MRADASWFERRAYAAQMKRVCAAGNMRCPEGRRLFHVRFNPLLRDESLKRPAWEDFKAVRDKLRALKEG